MTKSVDVSAETVYRLGALFVSAMNNQDTPIDKVEKKIGERTARNFKNKTASMGKTLQAGLKKTEAAMARSPSSMVNGAANTIVFAPIATIATAATVGVAFSGGIAAAPLMLIPGVVGGMLATGVSAAAATAFATRPPKDEAAEQVGAEPQRAAPDSASLPAYRENDADSIIDEK